MSQNIDSEHNGKKCWVWQSFGRLVFRGIHLDHHWWLVWGAKGNISIFDKKADVVVLLLLTLSVWIFLPVKMKRVSGLGPALVILSTVEETKLWVEQCYLRFYLLRIEISLGWATLCHFSNGHVRTARWSPSQYPLYVNQRFLSDTCVNQQKKKY